MTIRDAIEFESLENDWRSRLEGRSLVMEADVDPDLAIEALTILGKNLSQQPTAEGRRRLALQYRGVLVAGLCSVGTRHYDDGTYWPSVPATFGVSNSQDRQRELGQAFRESLDRLGLSRFATPLRNVGEILMHAGVPISSIPPFVRALVQWDRGQQSGTGAGFVAWARSVQKETLLARGLDVPTARFLTDAGEVAEDFVDRCLLAIDGAISEARLPSSVLDAIQSALEGAPPRDRRARRRRASDSAPAIAYDSSRGVRLRIPPLEHDSDADLDWLVSAGGSVTPLSVPAPVPGSPVVPHWVPVANPRQRIVVTLRPGDQRWELEVISPADPVLFFDGSEGILIPPRNSIPKGSVWVAIPNPDEAEPLALIDVSGSLPVIEHADTPHGWTGWSFIRVDTTNAQRIALRREDGEATRWHYVSVVDRPRLLDSPVVSFLRTSSGASISSTRPRLALPGPSGGSSAMIEWQVVVSESDGTTVSERTWLVDRGGRDVDPWDGAEAPILGEYIITARGPLGRGATLRSAVAESVSATSTVDFRWMSDAGSGLEDAAVTITLASGATTTLVRLDRSTSDAATNLSVGARSLPAIVSVPFMSVTPIGAATAPASSIPISLDTEALGTTQLQVRVPAETRRATLAALAGDDILQSVEGRGGVHQLVRIFNLAEASDTLARHRSASLRLLIGERSTPIARIRPRRLADAIIVSPDGYMDLIGAQPVEGLSAHLYPKFAPWRRPTTLTFEPDTTSIQLADEIRREGAAIAVLHVANPWVEPPAPDFPDQASGNAFEIEVGEIQEPADPAEAGFRSWLAGAADCPTDVRTLPIALTIYSRLRQTASQRDELDRRRTELAAAVRANRTRLMGAVLQTSADLDDLMRLFVESDVVTVPREEWESSPELWTLAPGLGVIADTDELGGPAEDEFKSNVVTFVGAAGVRILSSGEDPFASVGRFSQNEALMARWQPDRIAEVWKAASVVPHALLDRDSRADASKQLFDAREHRALLELTSASQDVLRLMEAALTRDISPDAIGPIAARRFRDGWGNLPAISIGLALVARTAARNGEFSSILVHRLRTAYAALATLAPRIVHQDLGLAELWVTRWKDIE